MLKPSLDNVVMEEAMVDGFSHKVMALIQEEKIMPQNWTMVAKAIMGHNTPTL